MAEFVCKVADPSGRVYSQVEAAQSMAEVRQKLADRGLFVYSVQPHGGVARDALAGQRRDRSLRDSDFLIFNQQFNTLIKAGLPILKALDLLGRARRFSPSAPAAAGCARPCPARRRALRGAGKRRGLPKGLRDLRAGRRKERQPDAEFSTTTSRINGSPRA